MQFIYITERKNEKKLQYAMVGVSKHIILSGKEVKVFQCAIYLLNKQN